MTLDERKVPFKNYFDPLGKIRYLDLRWTESHSPNFYFFLFALEGDVKLNVVASDDGLL